LLQVFFLFFFIFIFFLRLHIFLQAFKVPSCVLNAQMPTNSRCRVIREFNQGKWPFLIASECNDIFDNSEEIKESLKGNKKENKNLVVFYLLLLFF
jgi:ATP-dependent RNA helicase DDX56/DBP9